MMVSQVIPGLMNIDLARISGQVGSMVGLGLCLCGIRGGPAGLGFSVVPILCLFWGCPGFHGLLRYCFCGIFLEIVILI